MQPHVVSALILLIWGGACGRLGYEPFEHGPCSTFVDSETVALYEFEDVASLVDSAGDHGGTVHGAVSSTVGPPGCGRALKFDEAGSSYGQIPDSRDWDLAEGSVELWVRFGDSGGQDVGVLSRDAMQPSAGHFTVFRLADGTLVVRTQTDSASFPSCSDAPVDDDVWTHVGYNFGPDGAELYVNGVRGTRGGMLPYPIEGPCNTLFTGGLAGNDEPWLLGASADSSPAGRPLPTVRQMRGGAIDRVRISRVTRDFASTWDR